VPALFARIFWNRFARFFAFWLIVTLVAGGLYAAWSSLSVGGLFGIAGEGLGGDLSRVNTEAFAFAAAKALASLAFGLAIAFGLLHALALSLSIRAARKALHLYPSRDAFAKNFEAVRKRMEAHPLLGQSWKKFQASIMHGAAPLRSGQRPQSFFTYAMLREKCVGLKIMPGVPNYFVGAGLLLTFIGLLIALYKAAEGTEAAQLAEAGAGAAAMQSALRDLLHAATFKFSTSIAGLSASIALAFLFRLYTIRIEASLCDFCEALEAKLDYVSPQSASIEMRDALAAQAGQMRDALDAQASQMRNVLDAQAGQPPAANADGLAEFSKQNANTLAQLSRQNADALAEFGQQNAKTLAEFGQQAAQSIDSALTNTLSPLAQQIGEAVERLDRGSQAGHEELVKAFSNALHVGSGIDFGEISTSLQAVLQAMETVRSEMTRSGEEMASKLGDAAQNLNRLVSEAGDHLSKQSQTSGEALEQTLSALRAVAEQASAQVNSNLSSASEAAAAQLADAMTQMLTAFESRFDAIKETAAGHLAEIGRHMSEAQEQGASAVADASARTAAALEEGIAGAIQSIRAEAEGFASAMQSSTSALGGQAEAIDRAVAQTQQAADAFERCAQTIGAAIDPIARSNEKATEVAANAAEAMQKSAAVLDEGQQATRALSLALAAQVSRLTKLWENYESRFSKVDEDLQRAFEKLAEETTKQTQLLAEHTVRIDKGLAGAVDKLAGPVQGIGDGAQELSDAVGELKRLFDKREAA
jgi:ABC-type transporter Mla subunit MlaD